MALLAGSSEALYAAESETLLKNCNAGDMGACFNPGIYYDNGEGIKQDYFKAKELSQIQKACDGGSYCQWYTDNSS